MAPRREKTDKSSTDQGSALVLEYLRKQNRPYSALDVSSNLHNKVTKINAAKHLKDLHEAQKIECRVSGKQVVYHAIQAAPASSSEQEDVTAIDERLELLKTTVAELRAKEKILKHACSDLSSFRSFEELQSACVALQAQKSEVMERVTELKTTHEGIAPVSEVEKLTVEADLTTWSYEAKLRSEAMKNIWDLIADMRERDENSDMTKEDFWECIGCEGPVPK